MDKNISVSPTTYQLNNDAQGNVKIWQFDPDSGSNSLIVESKNLIVKSGASVLANSLAGKANSAITHFYIGYSSDASFSYGALPAITTADTVSSFPTTSLNGYVRIPLSLPPAYLQEAGYTDNITYFTTFLTNGSTFSQAGETFANGVKIYSLGLVNAQNPSGSNQDRLFSKIYFGPITYDSTHGLAITWGITFRAV